MPDFNDALSSFREKVSNAKDYLTERFELKRKKYKLRRVYVLYKDAFKKKWENQYKPSLDYVLNEFAPITLGNGLVLNIAFNYFLGWALTPYSVIAFGCVWYAVFMMVLPSFSLGEG